MTLLTVTQHAGDADSLKRFLTAQLHKQQRLRGLEVSIHHVYIHNLINHTLTLAIHSSIRSPCTYNFDSYMYSQPDCSVEVSSKTAKRYAAWIVTLPIIGLRGKVHKQTELHDNAVGRSERNALAHAGSVLTACAVPNPQSQSHGLESQDDVDKLIFYPHIWIKARYESYF